MTADYKLETSPNGYTHQTNGHTDGPASQSMDGSRDGEYSQSDQAPSAPYSSQPQDVKYNPSATPTSEYSLNTPSGRATQFPPPPYQDHRYHNNGTPQDGMAQPSNPPIAAAASPNYPPQHHYAPYPSHPEMASYPPQAPGMYPRPGDYAPPGYTTHPHAIPPGHYGHPMSAPMMGRPAPPGGGHPLSTVYSFVPIPGTHQQKRPRRRYEEIERMYKCGWNGCEKAYGTLNHLNAHVTMQAHGVKRTPEEFKEIRKEWKQRKKEEENVRKAEEERHRQAGPQAGGAVDGHNSSDGGQQTPAGYGPGMQRQLPPLGYSPAGQVQHQYVQAPQGMEGIPPQYSAPPVQSYYPPHSPYNQPNPM